MTLTAILIVAAALFGIGLFGALSQKSFVMLMMGLELLAILVMAVMAVELAIGFALVVAVYRKREADVIEGIGTMKQ